MLGLAIITEVSCKLEHGLSVKKMLNSSPFDRQSTPQSVVENTVSPQREVNQGRDRHTAQQVTLSSALYMLDIPVTLCYFSFLPLRSNE